jgi:hypothetical protein
VTNSLTRGARIVDVTVHRAAHDGAVKVELSAVHRHLGLGERGLGTHFAGLAFFQLFAGDQIAQAFVTTTFTLGLRQGFLAISQGGLGLAQGQLEAFLVDHKQDLIAGNRLVVTHLDLFDQARHIGRNLHDVGTDVTVPRPRRKHVVHGHAPDHDAGKRHHQQGENDAAQGQ